MRSGTRRLIPAMLLLYTSIAPAHAFDFNELVGKAKALAQEDFQERPTIPDFLQQLSYDDYQAIRFNPEKTFWQDDGSPFEVMMISPGRYYRHTVKLNEVVGGEVRPLPFDKFKFTYPNEELAKRYPPDLGYSGFKLTYPFHDPEVDNQFLVFAGASYLRGVGRHNTYGLSARGIAVDTGLPSGEEVPAFTEFWLERPAQGSDVVVVYGLLEGPSVTGAYRFEVTPGDVTKLDVTAELFFRDKVELLGLAPLTSMFYYGENSIRPTGEWRPQVHDSDGLTVHDRETGEWLWRPLINPTNLRLSYLQVRSLGGFGLIQRDREFRHFEDTEGRYHLRPSAWVSARGDWGAGHVVLVEIPTHDETNDNIVAFWKPQDPIKAGDHKTFEYTLGFGGDNTSGQPVAKAMSTFVGDGNRIGGGNVEGAIRIIVDFAGDGLDQVAADASVISHVSGREGAEVIEHFVEYVEDEKEWRLSILVKPQKGKTMGLRGYLSVDGKPLTETWTYELPPDADLRAALN